MSQSMAQRQTMDTFPLHIRGPEYGSHVRVKPIIDGTNQVTLSWKGIFAHLFVAQPSIMPSHDRNGIMLSQTL